MFRIFYIKNKFFKDIFQIFSDCDCNVDGSVDNFCDHLGQCVCNDHVTGVKCSVCSTGYDLFPACDNCATEFYGYPNCIGKKI